jgi:HAD superfamily hydrolase (TIGR01484 family)
MLFMEAKNSVILACDIDRTLLAGTYTPEEIEESREADHSLELLNREIVRIKHAGNFPFFFGTATGRTPTSHEELQENPVFDAVMQQADFRITSVGSRIETRNHCGEFESLEDWPYTPSWNNELIRATLDPRSELDIQDESAQDTYKVSYDVYGVDDSHYEEYTSEIRHHLGHIGITANVIFSGGRYLDILPLNTNKGTSLLHLKDHMMTRYGISQITTIGAGDSMNDADLLAAADIAVLPQNADETLRTLAIRNFPGKLYEARSRFGAGILEVLRQF